MSEQIHVLGVAGSLRKNSCNMGLLRACQPLLPEQVSMDIADLSEFPFYNADFPEPPACVQAFFKQLEKAQGLVLACPEYNYSLAPALKNALDWASRVTDNTLLKGKWVALCGAGGGMGTSRSQYHLRQVCVFLDLHVINKPEVFCNAFAGGFDEKGNVVDEKIKGNLSDMLLALKLAIG